ncbi:MAG: organomercurial lyase [Candidatus Rokuibacteriota bacterium]
MLEMKTADELITPEWEAEWVARRSARQSQVFQHIVRTFLAVGGPVSVDAVEAALPGHDRDTVREHLTALDAKDLIQLGAEGVEIAYPFSASPTLFVVCLADGRERYTCCAVDALGMAPMLRERVDIRSRCHHCGDPLALTVGPEGPAPGADGIMLWIGTPGSDQCRLATGL